MRACIIAFLIGAGALQARAGWFDAHWQYRRVLNVNWDAENAEGSELATAEFYTAGHAASGASDVRIVNQMGQVVPSHILDAGPGDLVRLVFSLTPHDYKYYAYFGNPNAPPPPKRTEDVTYHCGLLMDMHTWTGGRVNSPRAIAAAFERGDEIGQIMIDRPFYGMNPFGHPDQWVSKVSGSMSVPVDGDYDFAGGAWRRGALFIDGQPVLFIGGPAQRVRFKTTLTLNRGRHDFVLYDVNTGGDGWFSLGWRRPDMSMIQIMDRQPFGMVVTAQPAALEQYHEPLVADFSADHKAEYQTDGAYSQRYRLTANLPAFPGVKVHWDFGDGQTADTPVVDHVWVTPGVFPIRLMVSTMGNSDTQTTQFYVDRDWENLAHPVEDDPGMQSDIIAKYDLATAPSAWLPWMAQIHQAAGDQDAMMAVLNQMAVRPRHDDPADALKEIETVSADLLTDGKAGGVIAMLDSMPEHSDLQPQAAVYEARTLIWWQGDVAKAEKVLEPFASSGDADFQRLWAEALALNGQVDEARKILAGVPVDPQDQEHIAAISGAMARTIEYRIDQRDAETGEEEWEDWERRCPMSFLEGYSVWLRSSLMMLNDHRKIAAAKVDEAFARAVPQSPYAPQMLDRASRIWAGSDPAKSKAIRDYLKATYPEDPLSQ